MVAVILNFETPHVTEESWRTRCLLLHALILNTNLSILAGITSTHTYTERESRRAREKDGECQIQSDPCVSAKGSSERGGGGSEPAEHSTPGTPAAVCFVCPLEPHCQYAHGPITDEQVTV